MNILRMVGWLLVSLMLLAIIAYFQPEKFALSVYKISLITTAAWIGYWIDRCVFPYARPDGYLNTVDWRFQVRLKSKGSADVAVASGYEQVFAAAMLRRAIVVGCAMLAASLGM